MTLFSYIIFFCIFKYSIRFVFFFFSSRRQHTRFSRDWSSDVCSSDLDYQPPERGKNVYAGGKTLVAALEIGVRQLQWARYATEYDGVVGGHLARVLCGGELSTPQWVTEDYMLKLEREAFLSLLHNEQTLERIQAMLTTSKPLRN